MTAVSSSMEEELKVKCRDVNRILINSEKRWPPRHSNKLVELNLVIRGRGERYKSTIGKRTGTIAYGDLLKVKGNRKIRKVLVEGGAGVGKTSLCTLISEGWACGTLFQEFQLVLFLPLCREDISSSNSPAELLREFDPAVISYMQKKKGKGVLIIADGWDRLEERQRLKGSFLYKFLFRNSTFGFFTVIVTSRPTATAPLHEGNLIARCIDIDGFSTESINEYILSEFPHDVASRDLIEKLKTNPLIYNLCNVPINSAILCHLRCKLKENFPSTVTELCTEIILNVIFRNVQEGKEYTGSGICSPPCNIEDANIEDAMPDDIEDAVPDDIEDAVPDDLRDSWEYLHQLAFRHINKDPIELPNKCIESGMNKLGLVEFIIDDKNVSIHFLHQAFQEYLASLYVVEQSLNSQINILKSLSRSKCTLSHVFWQCFFGISMQRDQIDILQHAFQILSNPDHQQCLMICLCAFEAGNDIGIVTDEAVKALHTNTCSIHFGHPHSIHECDAILYVIDNMKCCQCHGGAMELNFKNCSIGEKQLCKLADVLVRVCEKHNLKGLDLSRNNLSNESVADLFNRAAAAFQSLEKLFLSNNNIGETGISAIMGALSKSTPRRVTQLDLSLNPLGLTGGLNVLTKALNDGALANLERISLQESLTLDANTNIQYLSRLAEALLSHCQQLQQLDLSSNDFGEPTPLVVDSVIDRFMTRFGEKFDIRFNREYMSKVEEKFVAIMNDVVQQKGKINYTSVHGVIVGPGRSGKDSLMRRLMGEGPLGSNTISSSTGVLEKIIKVEVKKLCTVAAVVDNLVWKRLDYDEEAIELMMTTVKCHSSSDNVNESTSDQHPDSDVHEQIIPCAEIEVENKYISCVKPIESLKIKRTVSDHSTIYVREVRENSSAHSPSDNARLDIFKRALKLRHNMDALREHLESSWSLYLTNTGGQMEFQELLPLLVCGPSVFFITFPLNKSLQEHYTVKYQYTDGSEISYQSPSTLMDEILQTLATIATLDCTGPQHDYVHLKPKVFFVGTHKDQLPQSSVNATIQKMDEQLIRKVRRTSLFRQGSIEFAEGTHCQQLMFTVNNLDTDNSDFQKIRLALQKAVERYKEFTISCPSSWLIFSLVLRAKYKSNHVLSYNDCFIIARNCGISDRTELNEALFFIHSRLGLIRYFSVKELNTIVVIDPQILFDTITKLIVGTFISDHAKSNEIEDFKRGIFSVERMQTIVDTKLHSQTGAHLPFQWLFKLLKHLRIAALFRDSNGDQKCFFSSVICHAPEQQSKSGTRSFKLPPPLLVAFESGFCPRGIPGTLITYLMNNEMKSQIFGNFYKPKIFKNQVSFNVGSYDIILKVQPTHLEFSFDPESDTDDNERVKETCEEIFKQIQVAMKVVTKGHRECDYYIALYCTKCTTCPAEIEWNKKTLKCDGHDGRVPLPKHYELWIPQKGGLTYCQKLDQILDYESGGVDKHLGQIADAMCEWEGSIAEGLGLKPAEVSVIKCEHKDKLQLQKRAALQKWKMKQGSEATYKNLIKIFKHAHNKQCADAVRNLVSMCDSDQIDKFSDYKDYQPSPPLSPPLPQLPEFPENAFLTATTVQLEKESETTATDQNVVRVKAGEVEFLTSHNGSSMDVEQYGATPREKEENLFSQGNPTEFSQVQKQKTRGKQRLDSMESDGGAIPMLSESPQLINSSENDSDQDIVNLEAEQVEFMTSQNETSVDAEQDKVTPREDPVSPKNPTAFFQVQKQKVKDKRLDSVEPDGGASPMLSESPQLINSSENDSGGLTYGNEDKSSDYETDNYKPPLSPPLPQHPESGSHTTATVQLEKEHQEGESAEMLQVHSVVVQSPTIPQSPKESAKISLKEIAARIGLDTKELERSCEEGLFPSFANFVHPWRLVFADLLAPINLDDVDLECHSEQEKRLGCLRKWKAKRGAGATVGVVIESVLKSGSVDNAESMCRCLLPGAIIQKFVGDKIKKLERQFSSLQRRLLSELNANSEVSPEILLESLTLLPIQLRSKYQKVVLENLHILEKAGSSREIFHLLNPHLSFLDYHLVEYLVEEFGSKRLHEDMSVYVEAVEVFYDETTVQQLMDYWPSRRDIPPHFERLRAVIDEDPVHTLCASLTTFEQSSAMRSVCLSVF